MSKTRYYDSFDTDFVESAAQNFTLPKDYRFVRRDPWSKCLSVLCYGLALLFSSAYCGLFLRLRVHGREKLSAVKGGFFLYGNHTQPVGDVFTPALCVLPRRIYTVVSTANYGIPVIGKLLPYLGALPITGDLRGLRKLEEAMEYRLTRGNPIVLYPEAHVWEYCTFLRPMHASAFRFPAKMQKAVFTMTVTYKKTRWRKRPKMEVFLDGPFYGEGEGVRDRAEALCRRVTETMQARTKNSNCAYVRYEKKTKA